MEISSNYSSVQLIAGHTYAPSKGSAEEADLRRAVANGDAVELHLSDEGQRVLGDEKSKSSEDEKQLEELKARDQEVRTHENAHLGAAGALARGEASYSYQIGADGQQYAVGGEVSIDMSKGKTPEETIQKMQTVIAAAMAPAEPSAQDRAVAAQASQIMAEAQQELAEQQKSKVEQGQESGRKQEQGNRDEESTRSNKAFSIYTQGENSNPLGQVINRIA